MVVVILIKVQETSVNVVVERLYFTKLFDNIKCKNKLK